ncbi:MAG: decaprenylphospho-beta-D-erythro-pentofuranosid-2-ulose 2-reductase [Actinobacteria bacterium]|nr:decaprenylphospho-beta-D-erythro-pentofuranosid-2-ulose 2-reductase [Actinomycetota bacterium]
MIDALSRPQSVAVFGATSQIAGSLLQRLRSPALRHIVLAARPSPARDSLADSLRTDTTAVTVLDFDASDPDSHSGVIDAAFAQGDIDVTVIAFGVLGNQADFDADPASAVEAAQVNYVGGVSVGMRVATRLREQGHGALIVLSSVAGERARASNYVYGSTKAGLDVFATGLGDALHGSGVHVMVVRPGFVRTKMTEGLPEAPLSVGPDDVADAIVNGLRHNRETVYVPSTMRFVMSGLRHVPRSLFRRLPI